MITLNKILSPLAGRALSALMPLGFLAGHAVGMVAAMSFLVQGPAQDRLAHAQTAYEAARRAQNEQLAARRTEETLSVMWRILAERKEFPALILAVSDLARHDGVAIPGMSYTLQKVDDGLALKASMSFQVAGDYAAIRRFIHRLETNDRYFAVESLDAARSQKRMVSEQGKESIIEQVRFNIRVMTFLKLDAPKPLRAA
jgi:Tfp pilus assembly protein PilO